MKLPHGPFTGGDIYSYRELAKQVPEHGTLVELGSYYGRSICSIAEVIKERSLVVTLVDLFYGLPAIEKVEATTGVQYEVGVEEKLKDNLKRYEIESHTRVLKMDTVYASTQVADKSIDLVFIDADHAADAVHADVLAWWQKVKPGGIIAGHDYTRSENYGNPGVRAALHSIFGRKRIQKNKRQPQTTVWHVQKNTFGTSFFSKKSTFVESNHGTHEITSQRDRKHYLERDEFFPPKA